MNDEFDVIVLGAGPAGENAAGRCADGGLEVALVERELVGGECSYWGCIPSKTLLRPGDVLAAARRVPGAAEVVQGPVDVDAALRRRDEMVSRWDDHGQLGWLDEHHITLVRGHGRLAGPRLVDVEVEVDDQAGGTPVIRRLVARRAVVIATGTRAAIPPIEGLREAQPWDNRSITEATHVPDRLLVLGGGLIGCEMAQAYRRLGSREVTVIENGERLLGNEEPFAGEEVRAAFEAEGITVVTGAKVTAAVRGEAGGPVVVTLDDGRRFEGDEILVAVGRRPSSADLGLDAVGLGDLAGKNLDVDDQLRVQAADGDWLYCVGDTNGRALLTHMGKYQARLCGDVILGKEHVADRADHGIISRVTFTDPQVCAVGLTEKQAQDEGIDLRVVSVGTGDVAGASTMGEGISGTSQLIVDQGRRVVVGATFTGPGVQELLHSATVAIAGQVSLDDLWHAVPAFPTLSEVWLRLLETYGL